MPAAQLREVSGVSIEAKVVRSPLTQRTRTRRFEGAVYTGLSGGSAAEELDSPGGDHLKVQ